MVTQLNIFDSAPNHVLEEEVALKILLAAIASEVIAPSQELIQSIASNYESIAIARMLGNKTLVRQLSIAKKKGNSDRFLIERLGNNVTYNGVKIGNIQLLYKATLPGELQAKLAIESAIDRFLEYLAREGQIIVLDESDRHVRVFIPISCHDRVDDLWQRFIEEVAFSKYGKHQLPGLVQTFIQMLNSITLAGRGFSTLDIPIINPQQANILAAWYRAVIRDVEERQKKRQSQIDYLQRSIDNDELTDKERTAKGNDIKDKQTTQDKEEKKYREYFQKTFIKGLREQESTWESIELVKQQLQQSNLTKAQVKKMQKEEEKLRAKIIFTQDSVKRKLSLIEHSKDNPFEFVKLSEQESPEVFSKINSLVNIFTKTASDQINSTRGDIFTQCVWEMYRIIEMEDKDFDPIPPSLLTEQPVFNNTRSPGDDSREFCYACGIKIEDKKQWQVLRFIFERPSQRRQSSSTEGRPHICASCAVLSFASPLKVTDDSIIVKLEAHQEKDRLLSTGKIKDYLRMLTNKELHVSAGKYLVLAADKSSDGKSASEKLGQVQYALAKVADTLPLEVLTDFKVSLLIQRSEASLPSHRLVMIKGLMDCYRQKIVSKEINLKLGDAIRYVQQDLPYLADYTLACISEFQTDIALEQVRQRYWNLISPGKKSMNSDPKKISKRAKLYQDVAALTGITFAFAQSLESTAKSLLKPEDAEREVSKLIEKVDDAIAFNYYATLGDENKKSVQARLYQNPDLEFIYAQTKDLLSKKLNIQGREEKDDKGTTYLQLYADDVIRAYQYFANGDYAQERDWKDLTYNLKLSLYTRFPELVRKLKSTGDK
jgi:hypothetical protein